MKLVDKPSEKTMFFWAGDAVPYLGQTITDYSRGVTLTVGATVLSRNNYYVVDDSIAFVLVHKDALPYMSGFETGTEFWNARSLTTNHYLIFGHNNLEFIEEFPRIRVKVTQAQQQE